MQDAVVCTGYKKEDLETTSFDADTRYDNVHDRKGNYKREFSGYAVTYRLKLSFDLDSKQLAKVIGAISESGAMPELSIAFAVKDPAEVSEALLTSATENARAKAEVAECGEQMDLLERERTEMPTAEKLDQAPALRSRKSSVKAPVFPMRGPFPHMRRPRNPPPVIRTR